MSVLCTDTQRDRQRGTQIEIQTGRHAHEQTDQSMCKVSDVLADKISAEMIEDGLGRRRVVELSAETMQSSPRQKV